MARAESGNAGKLLIFLNEGRSFAGNVFRRNFYLNLSFGAATGFSGAHVYLSQNRRLRSPSQLRTNQKPSAAILSVKIYGDDRQTPEPIFLSYFGTLVTEAIG
jgi:hypothetical protein